MISVPVNYFLVGDKNVPLKKRTTNVCYLTCLVHESNILTAKYL